MQFIIEGPQPLEANIVTADGKLTISPHVVRGMHVLRACYITAKGTNGNETKSVLLFNGNTGEFSIQPLGGKDVQLAFDKSTEEFTKRRAAAKAKAKTKPAQRPPATPPVNTSSTK